MMSEVSTFTNHNPSNSNAMLGGADLQQKEINGNGLKRKCKRSNKVKPCGSCPLDSLQKDILTSHPDVETKKQKKIHIPSCENCGKPHRGVCLKGKNICYRCGNEGHFSNDCTKNQNKKVKDQSKGNVGVTTLTQAQQGTIVDSNTPCKKCESKHDGECLNEKHKGAFSLTRQRPKVEPTIIASVERKTKDKPCCENCGKAHAGVCLKGKKICYRCGSKGHFSKDCNQNQNKKVDNKSNGNVKECKNFTTLSQTQQGTPEESNTLSKKCESKHEGECLKDKNVIPCGSDERLMNNCAQNQQEMVENQPKGNVGAFTLTHRGPKEEPNNIPAGCVDGIAGAGAAPCLAQGTASLNVGAFASTHQGREEEANTTAAGCLPKQSSPHLLSSEFSTLTNHNPFRSNDLWSYPSGFHQKDVILLVSGSHLVLARGTAVASISSYTTSLEYPNLRGYQQDVASGISLGISDMTYDRLNSMRMTEGISGDSNTFCKKCESKHEGECLKDKNVFPCGSDERLMNNCTQNQQGMVENQPKGDVGTFALTQQWPKEEPTIIASGFLPKPRSPHRRSSEFSTLTNHNPFRSNDLQSCPSGFLQKDILTSPLAPLGAYRVDDIAGVGPAPSLARETAEASISGYPTSIEYPNIRGYQHDVASGISFGVPNMAYDRLDCTSMAEGVSVRSGDSNTLFVDGLPTDCSRREIGHLFRPFLGFVDLRLIHKERRCREDKAKALCFVEFTNASCARTAKGALQGYKFDDKKLDSPVLDIHFVHFPFRLPSKRD